MSFNENIPKWIFASLAKHFDAVASGLGIRFYAEGLDDETSEVYQNTNISLRVDGPTGQEGSSVTFYKMDVQVMVTGISETNAYILHSYAGTVAESLRGVIPVYQIPESPLTEIGCLDLDPLARDGVRIVNLGRVSTSSKVRQIAVVCRLLLES